MNLNEQQLGLLDRFLRNEMSGSDQEEWKKMMQDPRLQDEIRNMTHLHQAIRDEGRERLRAELRAWDTSAEKGGRGHFAEAKRISPYWRWAAAAVLFAGVVALLLMRNQENTPEALFASYYEPYPNIVAPIQKGETSGDPYTGAFQLYESGRYQEALDAFETLPKSNPATVFYMALCQIETGDDDGATNTLITLNRIAGHSYHHAIAWYLALLQLKGGAVDKAIPMIDQIASDPENPYQRRAIQLRRELDHL